MLSIRRGLVVVVAVPALLAGMLAGCERQGTELGKGGSEVSGSAGPAGVLAMIPYLERLVGAAEQLRFEEAQVALLLTDNETTEQLAAATGSARAADLGIGGLMLGKLSGGAGVGWSNTNEGKVIAAAFLDAHNNLVLQVRSLQARPMPR